MKIFRNITTVVVPCFVISILTASTALRVIFQVCIIYRTLPGPSVCTLEKDVLSHGLSTFLEGGTGYIATDLYITPMIHRQIVNLKMM